MRIPAILAIVMLTLATSSTNAQNARSRFSHLEYLGERLVDFQVERDTISFRNPEDYYNNKWYRALHFAAEVNDVRLTFVGLRHFNGYVSELPVDQTILAEGNALRVPFHQPLSYLKSVEMIYKTLPDWRPRPGTDNRARIYVFAEVSDIAPISFPSPRPRGWVTLDPCFHDITVFTNYETRVPVAGTQSESYRAVRIHVPETRVARGGGRNIEVEVREFAVVYPNGQPDVKILGRKFQPGEYSEAFDLPGVARRISQIEIRARLTPGPVIPGQPARQATVCAQGLQ